MYENGRLTLAEFIVCLALGHLMHKIPILERDFSNIGIITEEEAADVQADAISPPAATSEKVFAEDTAKAEGITAPAKLEVRIVESKLESPVEELQLHDGEYAPAAVTSPSTFFGMAPKLKFAFKAVLDAFLIFDPEGTGIITRYELT